ncbi:MAG TPA: beta-propeller fold lactonase family protein [Chthoniobacterales bacterium]
MKFKRLIPVPTQVVLSLALAIWFLGCVPGASARKRNLVYINGNITATGQNAVIALINDGAGNMSPVAGGPFATGGTGVAGAGDLLDDAQWDADGEIILNPAGTLLFAVNGHSNDFSVFSVNADGSLTLVPGSPFPSGGPQPASLGYKDNALRDGNSLLFVANKDSDPFQSPSIPNYTSFRVSPDGVPAMNVGSTFSVPADSSPSQIIMPSNARTNFFAIQFKGRNLSAYSFTKAGIITAVSSLDTIATNVGGVLHPTARTLYITQPGVDKLTVTNYDATYQLSLGASQKSGDAPCWATTNKAGTRLYTGETISGSVTVYDITNPDSPLKLQHLVLSGDLPYATHTSLDPTESFLYVLDREGVLHALDVALDGTVSEPRAAYNLGLPPGTVALGIAVLRK